jgi:hypothetical protein
MRAVLAAVLLCSGAAAQEAHHARLPVRELLDELSVSVTMRWLRPMDDFGTYWMDAPAAGLEVRKQALPGLALAAGGALSVLRAADTPRKDRVPDLGLMTLHVGLRAQCLLAAGVTGVGGIGLETQTFAYLGPRARGNLYARVESEVGIGALAGMAVKLNRLPTVELIAGHHVVFTGPEYARFWSIDVNIHVLTL